MRFPGLYVWSFFHFAQSCQRLHKSKKGCSTVLNHPNHPSTRNPDSLWLFKLNNYKNPRIRIDFWVRIVRPYFQNRPESENFHLVPEVLQNFRDFVHLTLPKIWKKGKICILKALLFIILVPIGPGQNDWIWIIIRATGLNTSIIRPQLNNNAKD